VGRSAGSIVAGVSARTAMWKGWDDPAVAPDLDADPSLAAEDPAGGRLRTSTRSTLNLVLLLREGLLRTSTRPTLNLLLLIRASV